MVKLSGKQLNQVIRRQKRRERAQHYAGPVIMRSALNAFRNRKTDEYTWVKHCSKQELLQQLELTKFRFRTVPWRHQVACMFIACMLPDFLFLLDMGAGKSKIVLDAYWYRKLQDGVGRMLVLMPSGTNIPGWVDQIKTHRPELRVVGLDEGKQDRLSLIESDADVFLLNYDGLMSFMTILGQKKSGKSGRVIDRKAAKEFARRFDVVVFDESHLVGNKMSLRFRMCNVLSKNVPIRYALTGTPFGKNPELLWAQFFLVDRGTTFGTTLEMFRAAFFNGTVNYFGGVDWKFNDKWTSTLHRLTRNRSVQYEDREFFDMPKCNYIKHRLAFAMDAEQYYTKVRDELNAARKGRALQEIENSFLRMRQVCAGFLTLSDDETDEKMRVAFYTNPKLDELESIIDSLPPDEKVIVFHEFILTGDAICAMLDRKKVKWARAGGGKRAMKPATAIRKFLDNPAVRVMVANNKSGMTTGTNPQEVCRRIVFFDSPLSPIVRKQAERRVLRPGQKRHVYIHDLVIAGSVDEMVLNFIKQGRDLFEAIVRGEKV